MAAANSTPAWRSEVQEDPPTSGELTQGDVLGRWYTGPGTFIHPEEEAHPRCLRVVAGRRLAPPFPPIPRSPRTRRPRSRPMLLPAEPRCRGRWAAGPAPSAAAEEARAARRARRRRRFAAWLIAAAVLLSVAAVLVVEARTSRLQAKLFSSFDTGLRIDVEPGPNPAMLFPDAGPYDTRLGYARLPVFLGRLDRSGFRIDRQARSSPRLQEVVARGLFPIYREKTQAGLRIVDGDGRVIHSGRYPDRIYESFDAIPPSVVIGPALHRGPAAPRREPALPESGGQLGTARHGPSSWTPARGSAMTRAVIGGEHAGHADREVPALRRTGARARRGRSSARCCRRACARTGVGAETLAAGASSSSTISTRCRWPPRPSYGEVHGLGRRPARVVRRAISPR